MFVLRSQSGEKSVLQVSRGAPLPGEYKIGSQV